MNKIKVALIANTGIGNEVLRSLLSNKMVIIDSLCTRRLEGKFPYYEEIELDEYAKANGILSFINVPVSTAYYDFIKDRDIDLIIVASFHQILRQNIINLPRLGIINIHPSLLPKYRGPSPLTWILLKNESETGITAHYLTSAIDAGNIIETQKFIIDPDESLGTLFKKNAIHAGELVREVIDQFRSNTKPQGESQDEALALYLKRPTYEDRIIYSEMSFQVAYSIVRAFHPYPGAIVRLQEKQMRVMDFALSNIEGFERFIFGSQNIYLSLQEVG